MTIERLPGAELIGNSDRMSQADLAALGFLARYRLDTTRKGYATTLRQWFQWCADCGIDPLEATRTHVELWVRHLEDSTGIAQSTIAGKLTGLAGFYRLAIADGLIERNPIDYVRRPRIERVSTTNALTRPEMGDMLTAAEHSSPQDHALICLLGLNGLRVSEALGIDLTHLGTDKGQMTVRIRRKGDKVQTLTLEPTTAWAITVLKGDRTVGPLFLSRQGNRLDRKGADRVVKRLARQIGVTRRIHPHCLRHTFVTLAADNGVTNREIRAATGHADDRMISYYDRASKQDLARSATASVAAFVSRAQ